MAKRLQVILQDTQYRALQRLARARHMTLAEWVRQVLENARRREQPVGSIGQKLGAVRVAAQHQFPTVDIEQPKS